MIEKQIFINFLISFVVFFALLFANYLLGRLLKPKPKPKPENLVASDFREIMDAGKIFLEIEAQRRRREEVLPKNGVGLFQMGLVPLGPPPMPRPRDELHELETINRLSEAQRRRNVEDSLFAESMDEPVQTDPPGSEIIWGEVRDELKNIGNDQRNIGNDQRTGGN